MLWMRALVVFPIVVLLLRFLGRGLQFQSRPYDIAVQVLIGSAAANLVINADIELWKAFTALGTLALLHMILSFLSLWNPLKKILVGEPAVVIENGTILRGPLIQHQITVEELMSALREKGYANPADIEFANLEPSGKLSVIPRSQARPVTPRDLNLQTGYEGFTSMLVTDGKINKQNLNKAGLSEDWLLQQLLSHGALGPDDVLFASLDTKGQLFVVRNQDVPFIQAIFQGVQAHATKKGHPPMLGDEHPPH
jgi:uncharacterized membrane protein YcaP (DUF421 family)